MKFTEFPYQHLESEDLKKSILSVQDRLKNAENYEDFLNAFKDYDTILKDIATNSSLASTRNTIDTSDAFYENERDYWDELLPVLSVMENEVVKVILESPFLEDLKKDVPQIWFDLKEMNLKSIDEKIVKELQEENKLAAKYQRLVASAQIELDGEIYNLAGLDAKRNDKDRNVRKKATLAYWNWFDEHEDELSEIYDQMVHLRDKMAKKLGFENYIPLGYLRMTRLDYDQKDVANYRRQVLEDIVPLDNELYERQRRRLGYDHLYAWDEKIEFADGTPNPKYDTKEMVERANKMYHELSDETGEYFQFMKDCELLDLDSKKNKAAGGYCTFFPNFKAPFIFANFAKTAGDVETLTHEAGHAFQCYSSRDIFPSDCVWPTMESCEIHSMSMEFFTWPWMSLFFEEDVNKYYYNHLAGSIKFIPYGITVDHFQHEVYANPDMSKKERMDTWRKLEKMYLPHKDYEEIDFLERGGWWMRQLHIFMDPFYYIDYTLAQVCALQFWNRTQKEDPKAFEDYKHLCKLGGTLPFKSLVSEANLKVPFEDGCLKETASSVKDWFDHVKEEELA